MRRIVIGCAALLVCAAGCGSDNSASSTCDNLANALSSLPGKYSACGQIQPIPFDKNACVDAYNSSRCTDADRRTINDFISCVNALPSCTLPTQSTWESSFLACDSKLDTISPACGAS